MSSTHACRQAGLLGLGGYSILIHRFHRWLFKVLPLFGVENQCFNYGQFLNHYRIKKWPLIIILYSSCHRFLRLDELSNTVWPRPQRGSCIAGEIKALELSEIISSLDFLVLLNLATLIAWRSHEKLKTSNNQDKRTEKNKSRMAHSWKPLWSISDKPCET